MIPIAVCSQGHLIKDVLYTELHYLRDTKELYRSQRLTCMTKYVHGNENVFRPERGTASSCRVPVIQQPTSAWEIGFFLRLSLFFKCKRSPATLVMAPEMTQQLLEEVLQSEAFHLALLARRTSQCHTRLRGGTPGPPKRVGRAVTTTLVHARVSKAPTYFIPS